MKGASSLFFLILSLSVYVTHAAPPLPSNPIDPEVPRIAGHCDLIGGHYQYIPLASPLHFYTSDGKGNFFWGVAWDGDNRRTAVQSTLLASMFKGQSPASALMASCAKYDWSAKKFMTGLNSKLMNNDAHRFASAAILTYDATTCGLLAYSNPSRHYRIAHWYLDADNNKQNEMQPVYSQKLKPGNIIVTATPNLDGLTTDNLRSIIEEVRPTHSSTKKSLSDSSKELSNKIASILLKNSYEKIVIIVNTVVDQDFVETFENSQKRTIDFWNLEIVRKSMHS